MENPDIRELARSDPRGFLDNMPEGGILDEVQRVPEFFSYLQQVLDESTEKGRFILTGSNNFLMLESITQSLAGRIGYLELKAGMTVIPDFFKGLRFWQSLTKQSRCFLIYGGEEQQKRSDGIRVIPWDGLDIIDQ